MVIRIFNATFRNIRHVAISTRKAALAMDSLFEHFVTRVLCLQNLSMRERVDIVVETNTVIVFFGSLTCESFLLWEMQIVTILFFKVVFGVALCTDQASHFLMSGLLDILAYACPCLIQSWSSWPKIHRSGIMAVGTAHGVHHFTAPITPFCSIESIGSFLAHQSRNIRPFASPARSGLKILLTINARRACTQYLAQVFNAMTVPTWRVVVFGESITVPYNNDFGKSLQNTFLL